MPCKKICTSEARKPFCGAFQHTRPFIMLLTYDIEMQAVNEHNLPKRMRYYQAAIDVLFLDKGEHYSNLNDSYIIFLCLFDSIGKGKPVYSFENVCLEDRQMLLRDGTKKIIINANAFKKTKDKNLSGFLEYVKTGKITTEFTGRIEKMIEAVKSTEQARSEYRFISAFEMDALYYGRQKGREEGRQEGRQERFAEGSYQKALETAQLMKSMSYPLEDIVKITALSRDEIEKL